MENKEIEIALLNNEDIGLANDFFNSIYKAERDDRKFIWEFFQAPAGPAVYVVAKDKTTGKIVGSQCAIPIHLTTDKGEVLLTAKSEDTLVHPNYRGLNIFENMYKMLFDECEKRGIQHIWGFTYAKKPFVKLGFDIPYGTSQSLIAFNIFRAASYLDRFSKKKTIWSKTKLIGLCLYSKLYSLKGKLTIAHGPEGMTSHVLDKVSMEDNTPLINDILGGFTDSFMIRQDMAYLKWRLIENPYHQDVLNVYFRIGPRLVSHIAFNLHQDSVWYVIQTLYSSSLSRKQRVAILKKAIKILRERNKGNVSLLRTWDFIHNDVNKSSFAVMQKIGFTHIDDHGLFVWKGLTGSIPLNSNKFILSRIASEGKI